MPTPDDIQFAKKIIAKDLLSRAEVQKYLDKLEQLAKQGKTISLADILVQEKRISPHELVLLKERKKLFPCSKCKANYHVRDEDRGIIFKCKKCGAVIVVPAKGREKIISTDTKELEPKPEPKPEPKLESAKIAPKIKTPEPKNESKQEEFQGFVIEPEPEEKSVAPKIIPETKNESKPEPKNESKQEEFQGFVIEPEEKPIAPKIKTPEPKNEPAQKFSSLEKTAENTEPKTKPMGDLDIEKIFQAVPLEIMDIANHPSPLEDVEAWWLVGDELEESLEKKEDKQEAMEVVAYLSSEEEALLSQWSQVSTEENKKKES